MWNRIIEYSQKELPALIHTWGPKILMAAGLLFVFWLASRIARKTIFAAGDKADLEYPVVRLMAMAARAPYSSPASSPRSARWAWMSPRWWPAWA